MDVAISCRKQADSLAARSEPSRGISLVFASPARGALQMTPIAAADGPAPLALILHPTARTDKSMTNEYCASSTNKPNNGIFAELPCPIFAFGDENSRWISFDSRGVNRSRRRRTSLRRAPATWATPTKHFAVRHQRVSGFLGPVGCAQALRRLPSPSRRSPIGPRWPSPASGRTPIAPRTNLRRHRR